MSEVTQMVAQDSEKKGLHEDAVKLYDLAKVEFTRFKFIHGSSVTVV